MRASVLHLAACSTLALLAGCSTAQTVAGTAAMASVTGGGSAAAAAPAILGLGLIPQKLGDSSSLVGPAADNHASVAADARHPPRPVNPALLAQRAKLQALRTTTILGRSRALLHNSDFDEMRLTLLKHAAGGD
jgi:hypothetical protein